MHQKEVKRIKQFIKDFDALYEFEQDLLSSHLMILFETRFGENSRITSILINILKIMPRIHRSIENIEKDLSGNLERDLNIFVRSVITDLSTKQISPVDTGFFASSWTASTQRPRPDQSRKEFAPWSNIKPSRMGVEAPGAVVEPRFLDTLSFNF